MTRSHDEILDYIALASFDEKVDFLTKEKKYLGLSYFSSIVAE